MGICGSEAGLDAAEEYLRLIESKAEMYRSERIETHGFLFIEVLDAR